MRMRKKSWAEPFLEESEHFVIKNPEEYQGKWKSLLNTENLHVEIGSGKGDYFTNMATMYPTQGWIGIEKNRNVAAIAVKKALEKQLNNQRFIALDANVIETWFAEGEIDVIHLNFSDPWPKAGYKKRRLSHNVFLKKYHQLLNTNGLVIMKTDNRKLFEFSLVEFATCDFLLEDVSVDYRAEKHLDDAITEYEQKFINLNQPIYRAVFRKVAKD